MATIPANIPVDVAISQAYGAIQDDAIQDLRGVIGQIDENSKKKESLRQIQEQMALAKLAVKNAKDQPSRDKAAGELNKLMDLMGRYGYDTSTALGKTARQERPESTRWDQNGDGNKFNDSERGWYFNSDPSSNVAKDYDTWFETMETQLKSELDRHSDISSKLQVEMNTKSSILRRAEDTLASNEQNFQKNRDSIARKISG